MSVSLKLEGSNVFDLYFKFDWYSIQPLNYIRPIIIQDVEEMFMS